MGWDRYRYTDNSSRRQEIENENIGELQLYFLGSCCEVSRLDVECIKPIKRIHYPAFQFCWSVSGLTLHSASLVGNIHHLQVMFEATISLVSSQLDPQSLKGITPSFHVRPDCNLWENNYKDVDGRWRINLLLPKVLCQLVHNFGDQTWNEHERAYMEHLSSPFNREWKGNHSWSEALDSLIWRRYMCIVMGTVLLCFIFVCSTVAGYTAYSKKLTS